jgi:hypothetical protein
MGSVTTKVLRRSLEHLDELVEEAQAVARGWMLDRGDSVCLTDAGLKLFESR